MPKRKKPLHVKVKELTHTNPIYVAFISQAIAAYAKDVKEVGYPKMLEDEKAGKTHLIAPDLWLKVAEDCNKVINGKDS